jgi:hypothetical protein
MTIYDKIKKLEEISDMGGTEVEELFGFLAELYERFGSYVSEEFRIELEKEITQQLEDYYDENYE